MACQDVNLILYKPSDGGSTGKSTGLGKVNAYPDQKPVPKRMDYCPQTVWTRLMSSIQDRVVDGSHQLPLLYRVHHVPLRYWQVSIQQGQQLDLTQRKRNPAVGLFSSWAHCSRTGVAKNKFWLISLRGVLLSLLLLRVSSRLEAHRQLIMRDRFSCFLPKPMTHPWTLLQSSYCFLAEIPILLFAGP